MLRCTCVRAVPSTGTVSYSHLPPGQRPLLLKGPLSGLSSVTLSDSEADIFSLDLRNPSSWPDSTLRTSSAPGPGPRL